MPRAWMWAREMRSPDTGKFSTARWVCGPHSASIGTRTSPRLSCSTLNSSSVMGRSSPNELRTGADLDHRLARVGEEVLALVVDDDERGEVLHLDLPDRLHAEL